MRSGKRRAELREWILFLGLVGAAWFALLLTVSYLQPILLETWARKAIADEVEQSVGEQLGRLDNSSLTRAAERLAGRNADAIAGAGEELARELQARVAAATEKMLDPSCPCRIRTQGENRDAIAGKASALRQVNIRLSELINSKYLEVSQSLLREVRIFSSANAAVFLMLALTAWTWKGRAAGLVAPSFVLLGAATLVGGTYLFSQNWLQTILLGDYVGLWYFPYLLVAFGFMLDLVFNRARVSRTLAHAMAAVAGAVVSAVC